MRAIAVYEAKNRFSEIIAAVEQGEEITITRHGAPVARLVAIGAQDAAKPEQRQRVLSAMAQMLASIPNDEVGLKKRVYTAVLLIMCVPDYLIQR